MFYVLSPCCFSNFLNFITQDSPLLSIIKEVGLPKRPPALGREEGRDLSERVPPPRSSSPVIGSPPVRAVPIGTPPKQPMSHILNQQVTHSFRSLYFVVFQKVEASFESNRYCSQLYSKCLKVQLN